MWLEAEGEADKAGHGNLEDSSALLSSLVGAVGALSHLFWVVTMEGMHRDVKMCCVSVRECVCVLSTERKHIYEGVPR